MSNFILLNISCSSICALETPYIVCQKKHNFQTLHNFTWNVVKYLSFLSPWNGYDSISCHSSFLGSSRCVRAVSGSDGLAATQAQPSLSAKNTDGRIPDCCNSTGFRGTATVDAGEGLSSLPAFSCSDPALRRWWGLQMSKETNVCRSFFGFGRQAARTFSWHLSVVPKKPTLSRLPFFFSPLQSFCIVCVCESACLCVSWYSATEIDRNQKPGSSKPQISDPEMQWLICANTDLDCPDRRNRRKM